MHRPQLVDMLSIQGVPVRLSDGSWGARTDRRAYAGDRVCMRARSGKVWNTKVIGVEFHGHGYSVVKTS